MSAALFEIIHGRFADGTPVASLEGREARLRETIVRFEPRLQHIQVTARRESSTDCVVQLEVTGVVPEGGVARFRTYFQSDGGADIKAGAANARVF